jgi:transposase
VARSAPGLIAHVVLSQYVEALPLCRQETMLQRLEPSFTRQVMSQWIEQAASLFRPV